MAWTKQQETAINLRDSSAIVSAAAGSGKTAVLTERLAQLISDESSGVRADRIAAVTFTNDAASELKKRLDIRLRALIADAPENTYLLRQQTLLQSAKISTINSFCFELLRDNIENQGITSSFGILDESENKLIMAQSMDELINYYSKNEYDKISFMYDRFFLDDDKGLAEVISDADKFLASAAMSEKWLEGTIRNYSAEPEKSIYFSMLSQRVLKLLQRTLKITEENYELLHEVFAADRRSPMAEKHYAQADEDILKIKKFIQIINDGKIPDENDKEQLYDFGGLASQSKKYPFDAQLRKSYQERRNAVIKTVRSQLGAFDGFEKDYRECGEAAEILAEMLRKYREIIWSKKCERNSISFDDGERLVLELLADFDENGNIIQSEAAKRAAEFFDIIMIDEYQDSNNKQDLIFKLLSKGFHHNKNGEPVYGENVFLVGDVKQCIYKFRLANPGNFINTMGNSVPYSDDGGTGQNYSLCLNRNFRSSPEVISFVNYIFGQVMSKDCGGVEYDENEELRFGAAEYDTEKRPDCVTHISFFEMPDRDSDDIDDDTDYEAVWTAEKITSMINSGAETVMKNGELRRCSPSDFCILVRRNSQAKKYIQELRRRGIAAKGEEDGGYLSSREIAVLLDLLRIIDNPLLDVQFAAVMMSPMYMFEFEELAYLKSLDINEHLYNILNGVSDGSYECGNEIFRGRCRNLLDSLSKFRLDAVTMTVGELIASIYDTTDFVSVMQVGSDGEKKRANLRALIQYAKSYENAASADGSGGLTGFVRYIDRIIENGTDFTQGKVSSSSGSYVSVKTIHKSKGLEFPFVFLEETSTQFVYDKKRVFCSDDCRIGFVLYDSKLLRRYTTMPYRMLSEENRREIRSEEMRLFYVALTRAKQQLFIGVKCRPKLIQRASAAVKGHCIERYSVRELAENAQSMADWLILAAMRHERFNEIVSNTGIKCTEDVPVSFSGRIFDTEFVSADINTQIDEVQQSFEEAVPDSGKVRELMDIINSTYDMRLAQTPAKLSVTEIVKRLNSQTEEIDYRLRRPRFMTDETELTGSERGSAIHTFFQYCDFDGALSDTAEEIRRIANIGYISSPQADSISIENVQAFFHSDLYNRIKNADRVWREKKFMVAVNELDMDDLPEQISEKSDVMIKGIADLVFEEKGRLVIVDYKSDRGASETALKKRYQMQLALYRTAIELTMGMNVAEAYLYSFELKREIRINLEKS